MKNFVCGPIVEEQAIRSVRALKAHIKKENGSNHSEAILVIIDTVQPTAAKAEYIPRIIPIPNKLAKSKSKSILLITKDPSIPYREPLTKKGSPTEDTFAQIMSLKKVKAIAGNPRNLKNLQNEYDLILSDHRIHKLLPEIMGATFFKSNKKMPFMVQFAKPDHNARLSKIAKSHKLKDERCDPKHVLNQVRSIVRNTSFVPTTGTCLSIVVGYTNMEAEEIVENISSVVEFLTNKAKHGPVGGIVQGGLKGVSGIHVKTHESIALPVFPVEE